MAAAAKSVGWTKNNFSHAVVKDGSLPLEGFFYRYECSSDIAPEGIKNASELIARRDKADRNVRSGKPVQKLNEDGEIVATYESLKAAAAAHPEVRYGTMWQAMKKGRKCAGYFWCQ